MIDVASARPLQHKSIQQFIKFCLIGATSFVIDIGVFSALHKMQPVPARCISTFIAVINGFVWNSMWTFRGLGSGARHHQFMKFVVINIVGMGLNIGIMSRIFFAFAGRKMIPDEPDKLHKYIAFGIATVVVAVWNFGANKKWTFAGESTRESQ